MPIASDGLPGYEILEEIGRGGFSSVYKANDHAHDRPVAVKVLSGSLGEDERRRFDRERRALGRLANHAHVVPVFESGYSEEGEAYLVLEYEPGGSLGDRLRSEGPFAWLEARAIIDSIASAVEVAHRHGIRHRDIKPENILVDEFGTPKLTDFGIATISTGDATTGLPAATLAHAAPELLEGRSLTNAVDVYALGSTLHCLISGKPPFFDSEDGSVGSLVRRILVEEPPSLEAAGAPTVIAEAVLQAMSKGPEDRQRTVAEFRESLGTGHHELSKTMSDDATIEIAALSDVVRPPLASAHSKKEDDAIAATPAPDSTAVVEGVLPRVPGEVRRRGQDRNSRAVWMRWALPSLLLVGLLVGVAFALNRGDPGGVTITSDSISQASVRGLPDEESLADLEVPRTSSTDPDSDKPIPTHVEVVLAINMVVLTGMVADTSTAEVLVEAAEATWGPDKVDASALVADPSYTDVGGRLLLTGTADVGDVRAATFGRSVEAALDLAVSDDVEIDSSAEALGRLEDRLRARLAADPILFVTGSADIDPESDAILQEAADAINAAPGIAVEIVGHTDDQGAEARNQELSEQRAQAVLDRLVELGVDTDRLSARGAGESEPIADNETEEGRAENRRIAFEFSGAS